MDARALITSLPGGLVLALSVVLALSSGSAAQTGSVAPTATCKCRGVIARWRMVEEWRRGVGE